MLSVLTTSSHPVMKLNSCRHRTRHHKVWIALLRRYCAIWQGNGLHHCLAVVGRLIFVFSLWGKKMKDCFGEKTVALLFFLACFMNKFPSVFFDKLSKCRFCWINKTFILILNKLCLPPVICQALISYASSF